MDLQSPGNKCAPRTLSPRFLISRADDFNDLIQHHFGKLCWIALIAAQLHRLFNVMPRNSQRRVVSSPARTVDAPFERDPNSPRAFHVQTHSCRMNRFLSTLQPHTCVTNHNELLSVVSYHVREVTLSYARAKGTLD